MNELANILGYSYIPIYYGEHWTPRTIIWLYNKEGNHDLHIALTEK